MGRESNGVEEKVVDCGGGRFLSGRKVMDGCMGRVKEGGKERGFGKD